MNYQRRPMINKRIIISGATGYVGRFIVEKLLSDGHHVLALGRNAPTENTFSQPVDFIEVPLSQCDIVSEVFAGYDGFVHAAFHHVSGRYRGGEGDDPDAFKQLNHVGSMALFNAAKTAGIPRVLFLSSRAVYGKQKLGAHLFETTTPQPDSVYGATKLLTERALAELANDHFSPIILRATGIYGPSGPQSHHKWQNLFEEFKQSKTIASRVGTEVHGEDLAKAVDILLNTTIDELNEISGSENAPVFNISDILLDRRELLRTYCDLTDFTWAKLPTAADATNYNTMDCTRLKSLGWEPRGHLDLSWLAQG